MLGERLKILRGEKKIFQKELANGLNLSQETISLYETNKREPDYETLSRIADYFNVSIDYLLGRTDIRTPIQNIAKEYSPKKSINTEDLSPESQEDLKKYIELLKLKDMKNRNKDIEVANDLTSIE